MQTIGQAFDSPHVHQLRKGIKMAYDKRKDSARVGAQVFTNKENIIRIVDFIHNEAKETTKYINDHDKRIEELERRIAELEAKK